VREAVVHSYGGRGQRRDGNQRSENLLHLTNAVLDIETIELDKPSVKRRNASNGPECGVLGSSLLSLKAKPIRYKLLHAR
jgi:hypothetical protein